MKSEHEQQQGFLIKDTNSTVSNKNELGKNCVKLSAVRYRRALVYLISSLYLLSTINSFPVSTVPARYGGNILVQKKPEVHEKQSPYPGKPYEVKKLVLIKPV